MANKKLTEKAILQETRKIDNSEPPMITKRNKEKSWAVQFLEVNPLSFKKCRAAPIFSETYRRGAMGQLHFFPFFVFFRSPLIFYLFFLVLGDLNFLSPYSFFNYYFQATRKKTKKS